MLIFYRKDTNANAIIPLVLIDALCTDDIFTPSQIAALVKSGVPKTTTLKLTDPPKIFSTEYEFTFSRNGATPGNVIDGPSASHTNFQAFVKSPPADFQSAFSPDWFLSTNALEYQNDPSGKYANPQTSLVYASAVVRDVKGEFLQFSFVAYKGEMLPDPFGTTATLVITGGSFDGNVIRGLNFNLSAREPLKKQVAEFLKSQGITSIFRIPDDGVKPVTAVYFPPQPIDNILNVICVQNKLVHSGVDDVLKTVTIYAQGSKGAPTKQPVTRVSFIGAGGAAIANNFAVSEFAKATFSTQYFGVTLFDPILFINDTNSAVFAGAVPSDTVQGFKAYIYFVTSFALTWSRDTREMKIAGVNNWLLGQLRIDNVLSQNLYNG